MKSYKTLMVFGILLLIASQGVSATLSDIIVRKEGEKTEIVFSMDFPVNYQSLSLKEPYRIVVDCKELTSSLPEKNFPDIGRGEVIGISLSRFRKANLLRVAIELTRDIPYSVGLEGDNLIVSIATEDSFPFEEWRAAEAAAPIKTAPRAAPAKPVRKKEVKHNPGPAYSPSLPVASASERLLSLDYEEAPILTILRALAEYSGRDIIAGPEVGGSVTMRLRNVTWQQALDIVVKTAGFAYTEENGIIRVTTAAKLAKERRELEMTEPVIHRVYKLEFATPGEIRGPIIRMLSTRGTIEVDLRTSSVVVSDIVSSQEKVAKLIAILDSRTPQVDIEVKVVDIDYSASRALGIRWKVKGLRSTVYNMAADSITIANPAGGVAGWATFDVGSVRSFARLKATLTALEDEGKSETIANPRVTVVNNHRAHIVGGKKFSITVLDQRGNPITQLYTVGTKLDVTPHINSLNEVTMEIHSELSEVDEATIATGRPVMTTSEAETRQLVKDGETVVLGGFIREKRSKSVSGVPFLRSIPLIGLLFKDTATSYAKRQVLIFITPHILKKT